MSNLPLIPVPFSPFFEDSGADDTCLICGCEVTSPTVEVEMTTDHLMVPKGQDVGDRSQGVFSVGPRCARKIPEGYRVKGCR